ncbi:TPA: hypothetical protein R1B10_005105 [Klebsiella pneumoniae]|uniref:hypothetical protein n=1 Tax=Enterobacteriaceae TaxID=543 RepID=UPI00070B56C3|nr:MULTISPECIES: hypothetical protein [Enterobacteriaceae]HBQ5902067.1 hypothetical protein [Klebsiella pneumoniae subsp. pneumoniae]ELA1222841.1 hypothetical protein [Klebsiella pneumoniae]ELB5209437.1 hypothetical protein [Klebsiella pneumoniae]KRR36419.1 hypothetical protein AFK73_26930 [Klebsiella pneumoniae]MBB2651380.1 hypothetical protein [Klebsiella pneumoniae]
MTKVSERGMIFNAEMVRALLDGRKTQTRRIIKDCTVGRDPISKFIKIGKKFIGCYPEDVPELIRECCPYGVPGDRIWVRETWAEAGASAPDLKLYRANYPEHVPSIYENVPPAEEIRWTPSIHMPRTASRILLEITDVRVERLRSMSQDDARAEGVIAASGPMEAGLAFRELWDSIYGEESWKANPWVWVIEFKRVEGGAA